MTSGIRQPAAEDPIELELHRLVGLSEPAPQRPAPSVEVELAFMAGLRSGGAGGERLLNAVLGRCVEVTGFDRAAAYLACDGADPWLAADVGFGERRALSDFFGDPALLTDAIATARGGLTRIPCGCAEPPRVHRVLERAQLAALLVAPLCDAGQALGLLVLGSPHSAGAPADELVVAAIAAELARWLAGTGSVSALSGAQRRLLERLARAAEFRDEETGNHMQRVSRYCALLSRLRGLDAARSELIGAASMLHDIGKLGIPDRILRKPGALSGAERRHMERHAEYGRRILAGEADPLVELAAKIAWTHHERWDGGGYPRRLRGDGIALEGRIVAIGDVFDALTSDRVYRPAMKLDDAVAVMAHGRGSQFDPELLDLFMDALPQVLEIRRRHPDRLRATGARREPSGASL